jgi:hypothetical protein
MAIVFEGLRAATLGLIVVSTCTAAPLVPLVLAITVMVAALFKTLKL